MRRAVWLLVAVGCSFRAGAGAGSDATLPFDTQRGAADTPPASDAPRDSASSPVDAFASVQFVQTAYGESTSTGSQTVTFPGAQAAGDLNIVAVGWYMPGTVASVTDLAGNTYELAVGPTTSAQGEETQSIYYACGIAARAQNTVKVSFMAANQGPDVRIAEYKNIATSACLDSAVATSGSGSDVVSGSVETLHPNELVVAADKVFNQTSAEDSSYMTRIDTPFGDIIEDRIAAQPGSYTATATQNASEAWVMQIASFVAQ